MKVQFLRSMLKGWIFATCLSVLLLAGPLQSQQDPQPSQTPQPGDALPEPQAPEAVPPGTQQPQQAPVQDAQVQVEVNDRARTFTVHLPQGYDSQQHYPVVILLHGEDQDATEMARLTHFNEFADRDSIIAVYPNALHGRWSLGSGEPRPYRRDPYRRPGRPGYPPRGPRPQQDDRRGEAFHSPDVRFFNRMLDKLSTRYSVDTRRVYAAGLGDGGFMALRIGCSMTERIAAIAVVGAAMPRMLNCVPSRPISVLLMNGTDDPIVRYDGGRYRDGMLHLLSAEDSAREWARLDRCSEKPTESRLPALQEGGRDTKVYLFNDCREGSQVALYSIKGGGHTWPGGEQYMSEKEIGKTSNALDANETIWSFLVTKKIAGESGLEK